MNLTCIVCPNGCSVTAEKTENGWTVSGNLCPKGRDFAISEVTDPKRSLCSTVKTTNPDMPRLPVKTDGDISLNLIFRVMELINSVELGVPVASGDIVIENVLNTGVNIISTSDMYR